MADLKSNVVFIYSSLMSVSLVLMRICMYVLDLIISGLSVIALVLSGKYSLKKRNV